MESKSSVKVGYSRDPKSRRVGLRRFTGEQYKIKAAWPASLQQEQQVHAILQSRYAPIRGRETYSTGLTVEEVKRVLDEVQQAESLSIPGGGMPASTAAPAAGIQELMAHAMKRISARDLMPLLGYPTWVHFANVIEKARSGFSFVHGEETSAKHFVATSKIVATGMGGRREIYDWLLTEDAVYWCVLEADGSKLEVAQIRCQLIQDAALSLTLEVFNSPTSWQR
jgi:hypothetical protein